MIATAKKQITAKPFVKWAGGKTQLLDEIEKRLRKEIETGQITTYVEPFVGGGAVFFHIAQNYPDIKRFYLCDINKDLVNCYKMVQSDVYTLIKFLKILEKKYLSLNENNRKDFYLKIRKEFNARKYGEISAAICARLIFLNKTCFNGLYRVNSKNEFNVPFGGYKRPVICDSRNLPAASTVLRKAKIFCGDFSDCAKYMNENTFVYLDPPYRPLNATAGFTSYSKDNFTESDQVRLAEFCRKIDRKKAQFLLSNSDPKNENPKDRFFEDNYGKEFFRIERVDAIRAINCIGSKRGTIKELIITN
jgi:DNA adenine methylase